MRACAPRLLRLLRRLLPLSDPSLRLPSPASGISLLARSGAADDATTGDALDEAEAGGTVVDFVLELVDLLAPPDVAAAIARAPPPPCPRVPAPEPPPDDLDAATVASSLSGTVATAETPGGGYAGLADGDDTARLPSGAPLPGALARRALGAHEDRLPLAADALALLRTLAAHAPWAAAISAVLEARLGRRARRALDDGLRCALAVEYGELPSAAAPSATATASAAARDVGDDDAGEEKGDDAARESKEPEDDEAEREREAEAAARARAAAAARSDALRRAVGALALVGGHVEGLRVGGIAALRPFSLVGVSDSLALRLASRTICRTACWSRTPWELHSKSVTLGNSFPPATSKTSSSRSATRW